MPNILILEDEKIYAQEITRMVLEVFPSANLMIYPCVPSTLPIIPDLAILDIELEGSKDGIQFMHEYGKQIPAILFYSVCFTRIKESFGINVLGFVEKGEDDSVLKEKLLQAKQILVGIPVVWLQDQNKRSIPVRTDLLCSCHRIDRVIWFTDLQGRELRTKTGKLDSSQPWFEEHFVWINQGEAVNIHQIQSIEKDCITLRNGKKVYISRRYRRRFETEVKR
ncbi:response regulator transcription factor [Allobaculum stercoricanis]|uniref:LytR/AlgR family response regulator transcription factor n=1 Tax=Allobaculum stercoricanis TaxID=174709 RepID=UPI002942248A|nr:response regulator transcription factor [Allobaculum stercoricanis]